jgi:hypothetical protein
MDNSEDSVGREVETTTEQNYCNVPEAMKALLCMRYTLMALSEVKCVLLNSPPRIWGRR